MMKQVEHVADARQERDGQIVFVAGESVAEPRAVQEQVQVILVAHFADGLDLRPAVDRAELRRAGDVDHARLNDVLERFVAEMIRAERFDLLRGDLAVRFRQRQHLVAVRLDGAGLVPRDVTRRRRDDPLIGPQSRRDHRHVGLGPADQDVDVHVFPAARLPDERSRLFRDRILAVARVLLHVGADHLFHDLRAASFIIVAIEHDHRLVPPDA